MNIAMLERWSGKGSTDLWLISILFITFVLYRVFVVSSIHSQRELPIEVDDAYVYISQAFLFYQDTNREGNTSLSAQQVTEQTFLHDDTDDIKNVSRYYSWAAYKGYFLYSAIFGYLTEVVEIDPLKAWWGFSYGVQFLVAISVLLVVYTFSRGSQRVLVLSSALCALASLEIVHQITATPFTIANALLLIGWSCVNARGCRWWLQGVAFVIIVLALHVHPGAFVVLSLLIASTILAWIFVPGYRQLSSAYIGVLSLIVTIGVELIVTQGFGGDHYLSLFGYTTLASNRHDMSYLALLVYNYDETFGRLTDFTALMSFLGNVYGKFISISNLIYGVSLYVLYRVNRQVFIINITFLLGMLVGLLHYIPYHKGELIEYVGQSQIVFIAMSFAYFYIGCANWVAGNRRFFPAMMVLITAFFIQKILLTLNQIEVRSSRHNFDNRISDISAFESSLPENSALIVGDEFSYAMILSVTTNRHIVFVDSMRKQGVWSVPKEVPEPSGYIGPERKEVHVGGKPYSLLMDGGIKSLGLGTL